jgi:hypothetical protein
MFLAFRGGLRPAQLSPEAAEMLAIAETTAQTRLSQFILVRRKIDPRGQARG